MKIIGKTGDGGYLLTATEDELAASLGFSSTYSDEWKRLCEKARDRHASDGSLRVGAEFKPRAALDQIRSLMAREDEVRKSANTLRALADLIDRGVQGVIVPASELPEPKEPNA